MAKTIAGPVDKPSAAKVGLAVSADRHSSQSAKSFPVGDGDARVQPAHGWHGSR
jgi:hypothetical protein